MRATSTGLGGDGLTLQCEEDDDGEQQPVEGERSDSREEPCLVPLDAAGSLTPSAGEISGCQRYAQEDEDDPRDLPHRHVECGGVEAEPAGEELEVEVAQDRVGEDLEDRVERDEYGGGFAVAAGEVVPDQHHRDTAGQPDDDQPGSVLGEIREQQPGQGEHERRADQPVQHERTGHELAVGGDLVDPGVADLGQDRVHHQQQTDRDRQRDGADLDLVEPVVEIGDQPSQTEAERHRQQNPHRQVPIEPRQPLQYRRFTISCAGGAHRSPHRCGSWSVAASVAAARGRDR